MLAAVDPAAPTVALTVAHTLAPPAAQHRRPSTAAARFRRGVDLVARVGGLVSLSALLVLGISVAGALDGAGPAPRTGTPTVTVTIAGH